MQNKTVNCKFCRKYCYSKEPSYFRILVTSRGLAYNRNKFKYDNLTNTEPRGQVIRDNLTNTPGQVIRAALQLTSNLCVGNHAVQGAVWKRLFPSMFSTLLNGIDKQVKSYVCCILFHCTAWNGSSALEVTCFYYFL